MSILGNSRQTLGQRLLLSLAKPVFGLDEMRLLRKAASQPTFEWSGLMTLAGRHGIAPLAGQRILEECGDLLSDNQIDTVKRVVFSALKTLMPAQDILEKALCALGKAGVEVMPIKGPALGEFLYGDPTLRQFGDLDLLVHPKDLTMARDIIISLGFAPLTGDWVSLPHIPPERGRHYHFMNRNNNTHLELHWEVAYPGFAGRFSAMNLWENIHYRYFQGLRISWPSNEALLLFCAIHGARHGWSRLMWVSDVAWLADRCSDRELQMALALARELSCANILFSALEISDSLLDQGIMTRARWTQLSGSWPRLVSAFVSGRILETRTHDREKLNSLICGVMVSQGITQRVRALLEYLKARPSGYSLLEMGILRSFPHFLLRIIRKTASLVLPFRWG